MATKSQKVQSRKIVDIPLVNSLFSIQKGRNPNASILYEMPNQEGNEGCSSNNYEERKTSDSGNMPGMQNQNVPHWEGITLIAII